MSFFDHSDASPEWVAKVNEALTNQGNTITDQGNRIVQLEANVAALTAWKDAVLSAFAPAPVAAPVPFTPPAAGSLG